MWPYWNASEDIKMTDKEYDEAVKRRMAENERRKSETEQGE